MKDKILRLIAAIWSLALEIYRIYSVPALLHEASHLVETAHEHPDPLTLRRQAITLYAKLVDLQSKGALRPHLANDAVELLLHDLDEVARGCVTMRFVEPADRELPR